MKKYIFDHLSLVFISFTVRGDTKTRKITDKKQKSQEKNRAREPENLTGKKRQYVFGRLKLK